MKYIIYTQCAVVHSKQQKLCSFCMQWNQTSVAGEGRYGGYFDVLVLMKADHVSEFIILL